MIAHAKKTEVHRYIFDANEIESVFKKGVFQDVINTPAFRRLKSINFLGAIDYLLPVGAKRPFQRHTRYHHSLAVAALALYYCELREFSEQDTNYCVVAALLHDIGHAPLSHSLEPVFKSVFEMDHHLSGERIIRGDVPIGEKLAKVLSLHGLNNFRIMSIIAGRGESKFNDLFSHSINVDTVEAILRCNTYLSDVDRLSGPDIIEALVTRDMRSQNILDSFWNLKNQVYGILIQGRTGIQADYLCKRYMEINSSGFNQSYYYGTESQLRQDHRKLFDSLEEFAENRVIPVYLAPSSRLVTCFKRSFYIDQEVTLSDISSIDRRYRQKKLKIEYDVKISEGINEYDFIGKHQERLDLL